MEKLQQLLRESLEKYKMTKRRQKAVFKRAQAMTDDERKEELHITAEAINEIISNLEDAFPDVNAPLDDEDHDIIDAAMKKIAELKMIGLITAATLENINDEQ